MHDRDVAREWACHQALLRFFYCLDERRYQEVAALFDDKGTWQRQGKQHTGPEEVMAMLQTRSATQVVRHAVTNVLTDGGGADSIQVRSYVTGFLYDSGREETMPVAIDMPFRFFVSETELRFNGADVRIARHVMEPVFQFRKKGMNA